MNLIHITDRSDVLVAQQVAKRVAREIGFDRSACAELMIVASELASNILKYGQCGVLRAEPVEDPERGAGIQITAEDEGPPFKSFETALRDGFDDEGPVQATEFVSRGGTASGLGAVSRLTDDVRMLPLEKGKAVIATRYVAPSGKRRLHRS